MKKHEITNPQLNIFIINSFRYLVNRDNCAEECQRMIYRYWDDINSSFKTQIIQDLEDTLARRFYNNDTIYKMTGTAARVLKETLETLKTKIN